MSYKLFIYSLVMLALPSAVFSKTLVLNGTSPISEHGPKWHQAKKIISQAFSDIGINTHSINLPPARGLEMANSGEIDGDYVRFKSIAEMYNNLVRVPSAIETTEVVAFTTRDDIELADGIASLQHYQVGYLFGWKHIELFASDVQFAHAITKPETLFTMLSQQRFDLVIFTKRQGEKIINDLNLHNIRQIKTVLDEQDLYLLLNKQHQYLVPQLTQAINRVKERLDTSF